MLTSKINVKETVLEKREQTRWNISKILLPLNYALKLGSQIWSILQLKLCHYELHMAKRKHISFGSHTENSLNAGLKVTEKLNDGKGKWS